MEKGEVSLSQVNGTIETQKNINIEKISVTDQDPEDPDPYDQYVFEPPGSESGSVTICTDPDSSINKQKISLKKNIFFCC
jgi:hypothetical protein